MALTLVSTVTVGSGGAASIEFTNIPQTGKDLYLAISARTTYASNGDYFLLRFNGDTGSNYDSRSLEGNGSSASSQSNSSTFLFGPYITTSVETANTFGNSAFTVANYGSSVAKSISMDGVSENNATLAYQSIRAGKWSGTSAITSISIINNWGNYAQHTTASLYIIS